RFPPKVHLRCATVHEYKSLDESLGFFVLGQGVGRRRSAFAEVGVPTASVGIRFPPKVHLRCATVHEYKSLDESLGFFHAQVQHRYNKSLFFRGSFETTYFDAF
ncbi:hypothetical protein WIW50_03790, partial [Flavobacteriaceae bacterium 3-367]